MTEIAENDHIPEKTAVALGLFDGLHCGHRLIISYTAEYSQIGLAPAVFTFRTESVTVKHGKPFEYIYTNEQKLKMLGELGVRYVISPDFDDVRNMDGERFASEILCGKMNAGAVVCGENFRFGRNASCGTAELEKFGEKFGFDVKVVKLSDGAFSSEKYRSMLKNGEVKKLLFMDNLYRLYADVMTGNKIGRTIDFPTINQRFGEGQLVPKKGVYMTRTLIDGIIYSSVTNVGVKPTVEENAKPLAETHILDYNGNLYGKNIEVRFCEFIRDEMKFSSVDELKKQIEKDIGYIKTMIRKG